MDGCSSGSLPRGSPGNIGGAAGPPCRPARTEVPRSALSGVIDRGPSTATGRIRPFDSVPQYRVDAERRPGSPAPLPSPAAWPARQESRCSMFASSLPVPGSRPADARLTGTVELTALRHDGDEDSARPEHDCPGGSAGSMPVRSCSWVAERSLAQLIARLGDTVTYEVRRGNIERVDLGRLLADTALAPVSGRFALSGRGAGPGQSRRLGPHRPRRASIRRAPGRAGSGHARLAVAAPASTLARTAPGWATRRSTPTPGRSIPRGPSPCAEPSLDRVDLGTFLGRPDLAGPVTLHASGTGRWRGDARSLQGRVTVEPSKLGRVEVTAGSLERKAERRAAHL